MQKEGRKKQCICKHPRVFCTHTNTYKYIVYIYTYMYIYIYIYIYTVCCPQEIMLFLQNLPTTKWKDEDVEVLLAEAFKLKFMFADAPGHLTARKT